MRFFLSFLVCALLFSLSAVAAPIRGKVMTFKQPNGQPVQVRIWGDEFYQHVESLDGYTLTRDLSTGFICYAELNTNGKDLVSTGIPLGSSAKAGLTVEPHIQPSVEVIHQLIATGRARLAMKPRDTSAKATPVYRGTAKGLCLIIDFSDDVGTILPAEVDRFCNESGYTGFGNNGSVRDYFYDVSNGNLTYTNAVPTAYYRAKKLKSYYDNPSIDNGPTAEELIKEALNALKAGGFDFSQCDANGDHLVDALNCFYAGSCNSPWAKGLWPHSSGFYYNADGLIFDRYQITDMGSDLSLGTFCHENGHMVCEWSDLYDYDYDSRGVGYFCLMGYGAYEKNPVEPCAYMKDLCGWTNTYVLSGLHELGLVAVAGSNEVFKYENSSNPDEYYLVEYRETIYRDANLPGSGLAIWHCDRNGCNDYQEMLPNKHYEVALLQADKMWHLEHNQNYGDVNDLWPTADNAECGPNSSPNTSWWSGAPSYLRITNFVPANGQMKFDFYGLASRNEDTDGDGLSDYDETRDLNPFVAGVQNPFNPDVADSTGDNGQNTPDGKVDGQNDYDGDGVNNETEFRNGTNPVDALVGGMPVASVLSLTVLGGILVVVGVRRSRIVR